MQSVVDSLRLFAREFSETRLPRVPCGGGGSSSGGFDWWFVLCSLHNLWLKLLRFLCGLYCCAHLEDTILLPVACRQTMKVNRRVQLPLLDRRTHLA